MMNGRSASHITHHVVGLMIPSGGSDYWDVCDLRLYVIHLWRSLPPQAPRHERRCTSPPGGSRPSRRSARACAHALTRRGGLGGWVYVYWTVHAIEEGADQIWARWSLFELKVISFAQWTHPRARVARRSGRGFRSVSVCCPGCRFISFTQLPRRPNT
jgi:hypothetical protein